MKRIILILLLSVLTTDTTYAARSNREQLDCITQKVIKSCENGILLGKCSNDPEAKGTIVVQLLNGRSGLGLQSICSKTLGNNVDFITAQLREYEDEIYSQSKVVYNSPPALVCKMKERDIFLENQNGQYLWEDTIITCPTEKNYYAETYGDNSPAVAGDNNNVLTKSDNNFWTDLITGVIVAIIATFLCRLLFKKARKLKNQNPRGNPRE